MARIPSHCLGGQRTTMLSRLAPLTTVRVRRTHGIARAILETVKCALRPEKIPSDCDASASLCWAARCHHRTKSGDTSPHSKSPVHRSTASGCPSPRFGLRRISATSSGSEAPPLGQKRRRVAAFQKGHTPPNLSSGCRSPDLCYHKIRFRVDISQGHFQRESLRGGDGEPET